MDYELLAWPPDNQQRLGIVTLAGGVERLSDSTFGGEVYLTDLRGGGGSLSPSVGTADQTGTLRMRRAGTLTCSDYWTARPSSSSGAETPPRPKTPHSPSSSGPT